MNERPSPEQIRKENEETFRKYHYDLWLRTHHKKMVAEYNKKQSLRIDLKKWKGIKHGP